MTMFSKLTWVSLSAILLFGCSSTPKDGVPVGGSDSDGGSAGTSGADGNGASGDRLNDPSSPLSKRVFYFDLDSSDVSEEDRAAIAAHANNLSSNSGDNVTLEGHADERGSREYNLALGERRANAVRQLLTAEGASGSQVETVSYGEEKPAEDGHNEDAWQYNRRVELIYGN